MSGMEGEAAYDRQVQAAIDDENERWNRQHNPEPEGNYLSGEGWTVRLYGKPVVAAEVEEAGDEA